MRPRVQDISAHGVTSPCKKTCLPAQKWISRLPCRRRLLAEQKFSFAHTAEWFAWISRKRTRRRRLALRRSSNATILFAAKHPRSRFLCSLKSDRILEILYTNIATLCYAAGRLQRDALVISREAADPRSGLCHTYFAQSPE